ncbi:MAG: prepilin-type N-terminal cleavage/methylation domain-containing protein [Candidatus Brocadiia bacterium]|jgi:hypothetical protein
MKNQGLTLVEVVVVLFIVALLCLILIPVFTASSPDRRPRCASNLYDIGATLAIYCASNDDYLPSWACYGSTTATVCPNPNGDLHNPITNYALPPVPSRHMVVACSLEHNAATGAPWNVKDLSPRTGGSQVKANFVPVGLGILVASQYLADVRVLDCPQMRSSATTYYNNFEYHYDPAAWEKIAGSPGIGMLTQMFLAGDGRWLFQTPLADGNKGVAILSSYAYRDTPFYYDPNPAGGSDPAGLDNGSGQCVVPLESVSPLVFPQFMTPAFKTRRALQDRAICSDTFDYAWNTSMPTGFKSGGGLARSAHKVGYNVLYGDNHVKWYDDSDHRISNFSGWNTGYTYTLPNGTTGRATALMGVDDLTISSPTSQRVWNLFDRDAGIDTK